MSPPGRHDVIVRHAFSWCALSALTLVAGCATQAPEVASRSSPENATSAPKVISRSTSESGQTPETKKQATAPQREVYSRLAGRVIKPIAVRPIKVNANCSFRDPDGYGGRLDLQVDDSQVRRLQAEVNVPQRGNCTFDLKDFRQTASQPAVVLSAASSACTVRLWEQEGRVTVAFNNCRDRCGGGSFDYLWPILVDAGTGRCS